MFKARALAEHHLVEVYQQEKKYIIDSGPVELKFCEKLVYATNLIKYKRKNNKVNEIYQLPSLIKCKII